jgi:hypothetical protein
LGRPEPRCRASGFLERRGAGDPGHCGIVSSESNGSSAKLVEVLFVFGCLEGKHLVIPCVRTLGTSGSASGCDRIGEDHCPKFWVRRSFSDWQGSLRGQRTKGGYGVS